MGHKIHPQQLDQEEDDDEKMETFFAILRRIKFARTYDMNSSSFCNKDKRVTKKAKITQRTVCLSPFGGSEFGKHEFMMHSEETKSKEKKEGWRGLDLTLKL